MGYSVRCKIWEIRKLLFIRDQDQEENLADVLGLLTDFSVMRVRVGKGRQQENWRTILKKREWSYTER